MPEAAMPGKPSNPKQQPMMGVDAAPAYADLSRDPGLALIDALAHFAALYPGDIAYLHGVGPEVAAADGEAPADGGAEAVPRARWSMLGMRAYRRSHDLDDCDDSDDYSADELGAIGYLGYDAGDGSGAHGAACDGHAHIGSARSLVGSMRSQSEPARSQWRWFDRWILEDHATGTVTAIALGHLGSAADSLRELRGQWESARRSVRRHVFTDVDTVPDAAAIIADADQDRASYMAAVEHMQRHMRDGDIYVANMSMRMDVRTPLAPIDAFANLYADNPSPYAAYLDFRGGAEPQGNGAATSRQAMPGTDAPVASPGETHQGAQGARPCSTAAGDPGAGAGYSRSMEVRNTETRDAAGERDRRISESNPHAASAGEHPRRADGPVIVGSSPERFLRIWDGRAVTEPIKGTRPRGRDADEDAVLAADLHASAKEQAELLMVTDLERNDMNRFCEPGSVAVPAYEEVRAFPHVFHTVSVVEGRPRTGLGVADALRVMSPGGSITGTPKRRAMEIIGEYERSPRGVYTGSLGYVGVNPAAWMERLEDRGCGHGQGHVQAALRSHDGDSRDAVAFGVASGVVGDAHACDVIDGLAANVVDDVATHAVCVATCAAHSSVSAESVALPCGCAHEVDRPLPQVCDLSIVIRTAVMTGECDARGAAEDGARGCGVGRAGARRRSLYTYRIGAGGGVTLESDPAAEWDEAVHKARAVLAALGVRTQDVEALREGRTPRT